MDYWYPGHLRSQPLSHWYQRHIALWVRDGLWRKICIGIASGIRDSFSLNVTVFTSANPSHVWPCFVDAVSSSFLWLVSVVSSYLFLLLTFFGFLQVCHPIHPYPSFPSMWVSSVFFLSAPFWGFFTRSCALERSPWAGASILDDGNTPSDTRTHGDDLKV